MARCRRCSGFGHGMVGPGKFEGGMEALKHLLYTASLEWSDEEAGAEDGGGSCVKMSGHLPLPDLQHQFPREYAAIDAEDRRELARAKGGAIICEDSQGFVDVELFPSRKSLDRAWRRVERSFR